MATPELTAERARALFEYDPETGELRNRISRNPNARAGSRVGCPHSKGYLVVGVSKKNYKLHRLAWLLTYGHWPKAEIDHINGVRDDNRLLNLREANDLENSHNAKLRTDNLSGFKGVRWEKRYNTFAARIRVNGTRTYLGSFRTAEAAAEAYRAAATALHGAFANFGTEA